MTAINKAVLVELLMLIRKSVIIGFWLTHFINAYLGQMPNRALKRSINLYTNTISHFERGSSPVWAEETHLYLHVENIDITPHA